MGLEIVLVKFMSPTFEHLLMLLSVTQGLEVHGQSPQMWIFHFSGNMWNPTSIVTIELTQKAIFRYIGKLPAPISEAVVT